MERPADSHREKRVCDPRLPRGGGAPGHGCRQWGTSVRRQRMRGKRDRELTLGSSWGAMSKAGQAGFRWASLNHFSASGLYGLSQAVRYLPWGD